jgi:hypothetical protein
MRVVFISITASEAFTPWSWQDYMTSWDLRSVQPNPQRSRPLATGDYIVCNATNVPG